MSRLQLPDGDDHPAAARKHLLDAAALLHEGRPDGASYLSGYVVECALKSLWLSELATPPGSAPWGKKQGHDLGYLTKEISALAMVAGAKASRYFRSATSGVPSSVLAGWNPEMRYRPETLALTDAEAWWNVADSVFMETIAQMQLDGVI